MVGTAILFRCYYTCSFEFCVWISSTALKVLVKFTIQISMYEKRFYVQKAWFCVILSALDYPIGQGRIQRLVMGGGLNFGRFFSHENYKTMHTQNTKKRNKFYISSPKFTIFWKSYQKREQSRIFRAPLAKCYSLQVCAGGARKFCYF